MDTFVTYDDLIWWHESVASDPPDFGSPSHDNRHAGEFVERIESIEFRAIEPEHPPPTNSGVEFRAGQEPVQAMMRRGNCTPTTKGAMICIHHLHIPCKRTTSS